MGIDLDNLFDDEEQPKFENASGTSELAFSGKSNLKASNDNSVSKLVDRYKRLMYLIDKSGSEAEPIAPDPNKPMEYEWPKDIKNHMRRVLSFNDQHSPEDEQLLDLLDDEEDDVIKQALLLSDPSMYGIQPKYGQQQSKMDVIKSAVKNLVDRRYEKFPDAQVLLAAFDYDCTVEAATQESIKEALDRMYPSGGTNIYRAIEVALDYFERYPAPMGVNQIVLVTDGEDWQAVECRNQLKRMKELGVVLDYIFVKKRINPNESVVSEVAKVFMEITKELGGEYVEVANASDFERKLIVASERLCLPPAFAE